MRWHVVAIRSTDLRRTRSVAKGGQSALGQLLATGKAEAVFPPERRGRSAIAPVVSDRLRPLSMDAMEALPPLPDAYVVAADADSEVRELLESLQRDPTVEEAFVAPPRHVLAHRGGGATSSWAAGARPNFWGVDAIQLDVARQANGFSDLCKVAVGIIDSGLDLGHPDIAGAAIEYDRRTPRSRDSSGHGTHVTGIVAAVPRAAEGMRGVCRPMLKVYQALDPYSPARYYQVLRDALERCDVVNLSLGGPHDPVEAQIIARYVTSTVVVAAMGNDFEEGNEVSYPAALEGVIAVGAVDQALRRGPFSNTGPHIALCAPGVRIWSTVPTYRATLAKQVNYDTWDGTSMATPYVTGVIALLLAKHPGLEPSRVRSRLMTRPCFGQQAFSEEYGAGILDAHATLQ